MIATSPGYDLFFLLHIVIAIVVVVVFVAMHYAARDVARSAPAAKQASTFPVRKNWAARVFHLLPITGLILSLSGDSSVSLDKLWVLVGVVCYVLAAGHLEARLLPLERTIAQEIARDGVAAPSQGRRMVLSVDTVLALVAVALVAMIVQF